MTTAKDILTLAASQIGTSDGGNNKVKYNAWYYGRSVSGSAYPWCAAFVSWVFNECGAKDLTKKTASAPDMYSWFKAKGQATSKPEPGDTVYFDWSGKKSNIQHVGIVEKVISATVIQTIEGNTSDGNNSNGGKVMRRQRGVNFVAGYGRPKYVAEAPTWEKQSNGTWKLKSGKGYLTGWQKVKSHWYYLGADGVMKASWQKISGKWYYLGAADDGKMQTGWVKWKDKWYYLKDNGAMVTGWQKIKNDWYYLDGSGAMVTGKHTINGKEYTFAANGTMDE